MTIDLAELRRTHVTGWKPRMAVTIQVSVLAEVLDELERLRALDVKPKQTEGT